MAQPVGVAVRSVKLYCLPAPMRMPLKFGLETVNAVTCARVRVEVADDAGHAAVGWGETPISVTWVWPSRHDYAHREKALMALHEAIAARLLTCGHRGHPMEIGHDFIEHDLAELLRVANTERAGLDPIPHLAALVSFSSFDIAIHDAFANLVGRPVYQTYNKDFMSRDLAAYLQPAEDAAHVCFAGRYPQEFFATPPTRLPAWHLVGGVDPVDACQTTGHEPQDGHPVILTDWIRRDGLKCLKIKLRGNDMDWDMQRLYHIGRIALEHNCHWLSTDFNCTVTDPQYVDAILDRLRDEHPRLYGMILYVEQPFPYDLGKHRIDVRSVAARKPLFMDESAHDWRFVRLGRSLGWSGVALKTCKTQTGALLSLCWAKAHGMPLMVQDLTNPMLAIIPHAELAAHAGTIMGIEVNCSQFYPEVSRPEAAVHPGLYRRQQGAIDLSTLKGSGFGYRVGEISRTLPVPVWQGQQ